MKIVAFSILNLPIAGKVIRSRLFIVYEDLLVFISMHNVCLQVKLCGHATLAASHFIFSSGLVKVNVIEFMTLSGVLTARRVSLPEVSVLSQLKSDGFCTELDFPVVPLVEYTSAEVSNISQSLNGASIVDIKKRTTEDDLLVCVWLCSNILLISLPCGYILFGSCL